MTSPLSTPIHGSGNLLPALRRVPALGWLRRGLADLLAGLPGPRRADGWRYHGRFRMKIRLLYFARLRETFGLGAEAAALYRGNPGAGATGASN